MIPTFLTPWLIFSHPAAAADFFFVTRHYQSYRVTSDRDRGMGTSNTNANTQKARRRERRSEEDEDTDKVEDRERYRSRPRRSTEPDPQQNLSTPHSPPKHSLRHRSLPSAPSPDSDSASSQHPIITAPLSDSSPRRNPGCDLERDGEDQHTPCDETGIQRSPTRGEYHPAGTQVPGLSRVRSSSIESVEEWDEDPSQPPPPLVHRMATLPTASGSASQPAPSAGSFGMLSDSELADETVHLRALLGCPPGAPVGLDALADPPPGEKPNYPLPTLIKLAIYGSPRRRLTLQEIYQALEDRFEWFRQRTDKLSWKVRVQRFLFCLVGFWRKDCDRVLELHSAQSISPEVFLESATAHHGTRKGQLLDDRSHAGRGQ